MSEYIVKYISKYMLDEGVFERAEQIVRCRDCEFFNPRDVECGGRNWCKRMSFEVAPYGFCAWGKRREQ